MCWQKSAALSSRGFLHWQWPRLLPEPQSQGSHCLHLFFFALPQSQKLSLLHTRQSRGRLCRPPSVRCAQVCWAGVSYGVREHGTVVVDGIAPCSAATHRRLREHSVPDAGAVPVNLTAVPVGSEQPCDTETVSNVSASASSTAGKSHPHIWKAGRLVGCLVRAVLFWLCLGTRRYLSSKFADAA